MCVSAVAFASGTDPHRQRLENALDELDALLDNRRDYISARQQQIGVIKASRTYATPSGRYAAVAQAYTGFDNDSALHYYTLALDNLGAGDTPGQRLLLTSARAVLLPAAGFVSRAIDEYEALVPDSLDADDYIEYLDNGRLLYAAVTTYYAYYPDEALKWSAKVLEYHDRLLKALEGSKDSQRYRMNLGEYLLRNGQPGQARSVLEEVFQTEPDGTHIKSRAAHILSHIAHANGDTDDEMYYLINAVKHDLVLGERDLPSLLDLGNALYKDGDVERAYRFLSTALADGVDSKSLIRMVQTARMMPVINEAHTLKIDNGTRNLVMAIVAMAVLMLILVGLLLVIRRQLQKAHRLGQRLEQANAAKEVYISQFVSLCSVYMERLSSFGTTVASKIAAGKANEVLKLTKSGKYIEKENTQFYNTFDEAFLHLYPDFVKKVNLLMRPEEQFVLKDGEKFNSDLRILAFMRLGIHDSARIARILNYSVNTIYAYRNKLKARAINRDTFENDIMAIESL